MKKMLAAAALLLLAAAVSGAADSSTMVWPPCWIGTSICELTVNAEIAAKIEASANVA